MDLIERYDGCLLGLATGDAVGTTLEFKPRGTFTPINDMLGGGSFNLESGKWTDDTSMALCLAMSLIERNGFDAKDQMERYCRWEDEGYLSSMEKCFDIGNIVRKALNVFRRTREVFAGSSDPYTAGNGIIMRLAPVPLFYYPDLVAIERYAVESSRTTHGTGECFDACRLFGRIIYRALNGYSKEEILFTDRKDFSGSEKIVDIARGNYKDKGLSEIRGTGYVVDSLEAALWCFYKTDNFKEAILTAANLGDDADTTAAVCGQLAGAFYGVSGIPDHWLNKLYMRKEITKIANKLLN